MDTMILAAGRGERLRPLTDGTPKPLIKVGARRLIEYHLDALAAAGMNQIVINLAHLGEQIVQQLGDGSRYDVSIAYSPEPEGALETAGGIMNALELIKSEYFCVVNGDIWTDFDFSKLPANISGDVHLILVDNPEQHPEGDFHLDATGHLSLKTQSRLTFSGIAVYRKQFFSQTESGKMPLLPLFEKAIRAHRATGERYCGQWFDAGTPESLQTLREFVHKFQAT